MVPSMTQDQEPMASSGTLGSGFNVTLGTLVHVRAGATIRLVGRRRRVPNGTIGTQSDVADGAFGHPLACLTDHWARAGARLGHVGCGGCEGFVG
jgi:hypothetical protein